jgi:peptidoglycan/xylan/chitin deacetylase (PgdA/CDA1 family)
MRVRYALHAVMRRLRPPEPKPVILMYHRIADEPLDPWGLAVSPARFEEQLQVLRRTRHPLPLTDFVHGLVAGTLPARAVALAFDDGYADNLFAGKPRLAAADIPATVFLATGYLGRTEEFWWDELARLVLLQHGPQKLELVVRGEALEFELGTERLPRANDAWRAWAAPLTRRQRAYIAIWQALRALEDEERQALMAKLRSAFGGGYGHPTSSRPMTPEEVRTLVADGLVTIGAHTVTHPPLTSIEAGARRSEIVESKAVCEALIGTHVSGFAYPHGDLNDEVRSDVEDAGLAYACSTRHAPVTARSEIFALPRIHVLDWDGDGFGRSICSLG